MAILLSGPMQNELILLLNSTVIVFLLETDETSLLQVDISRENWLSPVIQATWEARTRGWLEVERLLPSAYRDSVAALWPPYLG